MTMQGAHSSAWIEWLPAEQLVEGSSPSGPVTRPVLFSGFQDNKGDKERVELQSEVDPWALYLYAMKAPITRDKYQRRLAKFLEFQIWLSFWAWSFVD
jgi:hypothetical protein